MNLFYSFTLTIIAGLSTMIGCVFIFLKNDTQKTIVKSLSFAAGVMITVSITDLIPESFLTLRNIYLVFPTVIYILIFIIIGIILSMTIDKYLPNNISNDKLYRVGIISMLAIILHNIPEGCVQYVSH